MTEQTPLDQAHALMMADIDDNAARLAFYSILADSELFILLEHEAGPDSISPEVLDLEGTHYTLVFDREERLADFTGQPAPYAALPGRIIAGMLAGDKMGMGLNLGVAPSSILIPAGAMNWLQEALAETPTQSMGQISKISAPEAGLQPLLEAVQQKLRMAGGLAQAAYLASAVFQDGRKNALLAVIAAPEAAHAALARAAQEALVFSSLKDQRLDVVFLETRSKLATELASIGHAFALPPPEPENLNLSAPTAPGSNPDKPPILK